MITVVAAAQSPWLAAGWIVGHQAAPPGLVKPAMRRSPFGGRLPATPAASEPAPTQEEAPLDAWSAFCARLEGTQDDASTTTKSGVRAPRQMRRVWRKQLERHRAKPPQATSILGTPEARWLKGAQNPRLMRVVAGEARGRRLESPATLLRPMMSKVREAMFSTLGTLGVFGATRRVRVLDAFAGSGAVGVEALSRGAAFAAFVDVSSEACAVAERNAATCGYDSQRCRAFTTTAEAALAGAVLRRPPTTTTSGTTGIPYSGGGRPHPPPKVVGAGTEKFDVVSLTPPYEEVSYPALLRAVASSPVVNDDAVVVVEYPVELGTLPPVAGDNGELVGLRNRRYGRTVLAFYAFKPTGALPFHFHRDEFLEDPRRKRR